MDIASILQDLQIKQLVDSITGSMFDASGQKAEGLLVPGNINIHQRPVIKNSDGSFSTVRSANFEDDAGRNVVIPTAIPGRGIVPIDEAIKYYQATGQHLGIFDTSENAEKYAMALHQQQAVEYSQ